MNKTKSVSTTGTLIRTEIKPAVAKVALFIFAIMVGFSSEKIIARFKEEREKMIKFGIDPGMFQALLDYFKKGETPTLSKEKAELIAYYYMVYNEANGISVIKWLAKISTAAPFKFIFETVSTTPVEHLEFQKSSISKVLKSLSVKWINVFAVTINSKIKEISDQYPYMAEQLGMKKITLTLTDLIEFIACLTHDTTFVNKIEFADAVIEQKDFISQKINCSVKDIVAFANELKKQETYFNSNNNPKINTVATRLIMGGFTAFTLVKLSEVDRTIVALNASHAS